MTRWTDDHTGVVFNKTVEMIREINELRAALDDERLITAHLRDVLQSIAKQRNVNRDTLRAKIDIELRVTADHIRAAKES